MSRFIGIGNVLCWCLGGEFVLDMNVDVCDWLMVFEVVYEVFNIGLDFVFYVLDDVVNFIEYVFGVVVWEDDKIVYWVGDRVEFIVFLNWDVLVG